MSLIKENVLVNCDGTEEAPNCNRCSTCGPGGDCANINKETELHDTLSVLYTMGTNLFAPGELNGPTRQLVPPPVLGKDKL